MNYSKPYTTEGLFGRRKRSLVDSLSSVRQVKIDNIELEDGTKVKVKVHSIRDLLERSKR